MGTVTRGIDQRQVRKVYAIANALGMVEHGSHDDDLHALVAGMTGKQSVKALTWDEAYDLIQELERKQGKPPQRKQPAKQEDTARAPGGVTQGQKAKVWALMYELQRYDPQPVKTSLGTRLCGVIRRTYGIDAKESAPFAWLGYARCNKLIETIKALVERAKQQAGDDGGGD